VHNIFHEKQHTGQVWNIRDELRLLQGWDNAALYPLLVDYYLSRAQLISSPFGLTDDQLDAPPPESGWLDPLLVRLEADHLLRDPLDHIRREPFTVERLERSRLGYIERGVARRQSDALTHRSKSAPEPPAP